MAIVVAVLAIAFAAMRRFSPAPRGERTVSDVEAPAADASDDTAPDTEPAPRSHDGEQGPPPESHLADFYAEPLDAAFARSMRPAIERDMTQFSRTTGMLVESIDCRSVTCIARTSTVREDLTLEAARTALEHVTVDGRCTHELRPSFIPDAGLSTLDVLFHCAGDGDAAAH